MGLAEISCQLLLPYTFHFKQCWLLSCCAIKIEIPQNTDDVVGCTTSYTTMRGLATTILRWLAGHFRVLVDSVLIRPTSKIFSKLVHMPWLVKLLPTSHLRKNTSNESVCILYFLHFTIYILFWAKKEVELYAIRQHSAIEAGECSAYNATGCFM